MTKIAFILLFGFLMHEPIQDYCYNPNVDSTQVQDKKGLNISNPQSLNRCIDIISKLIK